MTTTPQQLLDLELPSNDAQAATVRDYLKALLYDVWRYEEGFNGKRPFGNSSWQYEIYTPMIAAGMVPGITLASDGEIMQPWTEWQRARENTDRLILEAIKTLQ